MKSDNRVSKAAEAANDLAEIIFRIPVLCINTKSYLFGTLWQHIRRIWSSHGSYLGIYRTQICPRIRRYQVCYLISQEIRPVDKAPAVANSKFGYGITRYRN